MAKKVEIEIDVNSNLSGSIKELKELKKELKSAAVGSDEFKRIFNQIDDLEDKIKSAKNVSSDWVDTLAAAPGPLGLAGRAINGLKVATQSFGAALKATGIGLLVALVGGLAAAFSQSEEAGKKLQPLFEGIQKILGGLFRVLEPVLDSFIEMATTALPYVTKGIGIFYSAIYALFTYLKTAGEGVFKFWKGLLTLDFGLVEEGVKGVTGSFGKAADAYTETMGRFEAGTKELTKTEKEELAKRQEAEKAALEKRRQQQEEYRKKVEEDTRTANNKLLELQNEYEQLSAKRENEASQIKLRQDFDREQKEINALKLKNQTINGIAVSAEELRNKLLLQSRTNYLKKKQKLEDDDLKAFQDTVKQGLDLQKQFTDKINQLTIAGLKDEFEQKKAERKLNLEKDKEDITKIETELIAVYKKLIEQYPSARADMEKAMATITEKAILARKIAEQNSEIDIIKIGLDAKKQREETLMKQLDAELKILELRNQVLNNKTQSFFRNQQELLKLTYEKEKIIQTEFYDDLLLRAKGNAEEEARIERQKIETLLGIEKKYQEDKKNLKQQEIAAYGEVASATIQSFAGITAALAQGYDEEAKTSKKAFEQRKKLQIATALMSSASGLIQILTQPSTLPSPFDWIVKLANAAALGITTAIQIKNIKKTQFEGAAGGEGAQPSGNQMGRGYADGGIVRGPGTSKSDSIPARLSNGEAVMTSGSVTMFAPLLSMMNQMGGGTSFASGLNVTSPDNPSRTNPAMEQQPLIIKTYVVENEMTNSQQRQARLKDLSTL